MTDALLSRSVPFEIEMRADGESNDGLTLTGYAAVFDQPTRINSWEGCFDEVIARGAFKKSLAERSPVVQFDHGRHPMVGSIPLGAHNEAPREDKQGVFVNVRLHDNWLIQPVRDAVASKAIGGMSFRFGVVKDEWRDATGALVKGDDVQRRLWETDPAKPNTIMTRTLKEVRCVELGPVVFPAYAGTSVGVRSQELAALLTDPEVRAELARRLVGTPTEPSEPVGAPVTDEPPSTTEEPRDAHSPAVHISSPAARKRHLIREGVINDG